MTSWYHEKGIGGWGVMWKDGAAWYSFRPDQFGKVRSASHSSGDFDPGSFGSIQTLVAELLPRLNEKRFGTAHSYNRGILCGRVCSHLNGVGFDPRKPVNDC